MICDVKNTFNDTKVYFLLKFHGIYTFRQVLRPCVKRVERQTASKRYDEVKQEWRFDQFLNPQITAKAFSLCPFVVRFMEMLIDIILQFSVFSKSKILKNSLITP